MEPKNPNMTFTEDDLASQREKNTHLLQETALKLINQFPTYQILKFDLNLQGWKLYAIEGTATTIVDIDDLGSILTPETWHIIHIPGMTDAASLYSLRQIETVITNLTNQPHSIIENTLAQKLTDAWKKIQPEIEQKLKNILIQQGPQLCKILNRYLAVRNEQLKDETTIYELRSYMATKLLHPIETMISGVNLTLGQEGISIQKKLSEIKDWIENDLNAAMKTAKNVEQKEKNEEEEKKVMELYQEGLQENIRTRAQTLRKIHCLKAGIALERAELVYAQQHSGSQLTISIRPTLLQIQEPALPSDMEMLSAPGFLAFKINQDLETLEKRLAASDFADTHQTAHMLDFHSGNLADKAVGRNFGELFSISQSLPTSEYLKKTALGMLLACTKKSFRDGITLKLLERYGTSNYQDDTHEKRHIAARRALEQTLTLFIEHVRHPNFIQKESDLYTSDLYTLDKEECTMRYSFIILRLIALAQKMNIAKVDELKTLFQQLNKQSSAFNNQSINLIVNQFKKYFDQGTIARINKR